MEEEEQLSREFNEELEWERWEREGMEEEEDLSREFNDELKREQQQDRITQQIYEQLMKEVVDEEAQLELKWKEAVDKQAQLELKWNQEEHSRYLAAQLRRDLYINTEMDRRDRTAMMDALRTVLSLEDFQKVEALPEDELTQMSKRLSKLSPGDFVKPDGKTPNVEIRQLSIPVPPSYPAVKLQKDNENFKNCLLTLSIFNSWLRANRLFQVNQLMDRSTAAERFVTRYLAEHPSVELNETDAANLGAIRQRISENW